MGSAIPLPARCLAPRVQNNIRFWQWGNFHLMSHPTKRCALPQRRGPRPPFLVLLSYFTSLAPLGAPRPRFARSARQFSPFLEPQEPKFLRHQQRTTSLHLVIASSIFVHHRSRRPPTHTRLRPRPASGLLCDAMSSSNNRDDTGRAHNKRKRELSATEAAAQSDVSDAAPAAKSKGAETGAFNVALSPAMWRQSLIDLAGTGTVVPPTVALVFYETYSDCVSHFKSAQSTLQRAMASQSKFALATANGVVPSSLSKHLKLPPHQPLQAAIGALEDERVVAAKTAAETAIATARTSTISFLSTLHTVQVEKCRNQIDVKATVNALGTALTTYAHGIISASDDDVLTVWDPCVTLLKTALTSELKTLKFEFTARLQKEAESRDAKATAVANARADAEMEVDTRPIDEMLNEKIQRALAKLGARLIVDHIPLTDADFALPPHSYGEQRPHEVSETRALQGKASFLQSDGAQSPKALFFVNCEKGIQGEKGVDVQGEEEAGQTSQGDQSQSESEGEGEGKSRKRRRRRRRRRGKAHARESESDEGEEEGRSSGRVGRQRLGLSEPRSDPTLDVASWVSSPGPRFHHRRPDTYPESFFVAPQSSRVRFVTGQMTELYYDTRIRNRTFHNLTNVSLTPEQIKTLSLNQKFVPRPNATDLQPTLDAVDDFQRRLRLRVDKEISQPKTLHSFFGGEELERGQPRYVPSFHIPEPDAAGPALIDEIESALSKTRNQIEVEVLSKRALLIRPNIRQNDLDALLRLLADNSVLAVPADKNLGLCLVTSTWYEEMAFKLLENDSYVEDQPDHVGLLLTLRKIVEKSKDLVTVQQHRWLAQPCKDELQKVPILKVLPKIHKLPISGRPIVPTFGTLLANASVWVDFQIKPLLERFPWILRDSKTFCHDLLNVELPPGEDIWLVTGDVVAMYPNIPMGDGIAQIAAILNTSPMEFKTLDEAALLKIRNRKELVIVLLRLILQFNYVKFGDNTYRQVVGTAMGTACAPTYANLFLAGYEVPALDEFKDMLLFYRRFIDDTFAIIKGTIEDVRSFQRRFGSLHPNMRMEWTESRHRLPFLDVHVSLEFDHRFPAFNPRMRLSTNVYQKALNAYLYIPWISCHSDDSKRAWVKGELIRYVRICSKEPDFANVRNDFVKRLRDRGYPGRWLRRVVDEVKYKVERPKALTPPMSKDPFGEPLLHVLKLTHNPVWDRIDLRPIWRDLQDTWTEFGVGLPQYRFMASFKKPIALGDRLNKNNRDTLEEYQKRTVLDV